MHSIVSFSDLFDPFYKDFPLKNIPKVSVNFHFFSDKLSQMQTFLEKKWNDVKVQVVDLTTRLTVTIQFILRKVFKKPFVNVHHEKFIQALEQLGQIQAECRKKGHELLEAQLNQVGNLNKATFTFIRIEKEIDHQLKLMAAILEEIKLYSPLPPCYQKVEKMRNCLLEDKAYLLKKIKEKKEEIFNLFEQKCGILEGQKSDKNDKALSSFRRTERSWSFFKNILLASETASRVGVIDTSLSKLKNFWAAEIANRNEDIALQSKPPIGLPNFTFHLSNTCYLNSTLQSLLYIPEIQKKLEEELTGQDLVHLRQRQAVQEALRDLSHLIKTKVQEQSFSRFYAFLNAFSFLEREFSSEEEEVIVRLQAALRSFNFDLRNEPNHQQDAAAVMRILMDEIFNFKVKTRRTDSTEKIKGMIFPRRTEEETALMLSFPETSPDSSEEEHSYTLMEILEKDWNKTTDNKDTDFDLNDGLKIDEEVALDESLAFKKGGKIARPGIYQEKTQLLSLPSVLVVQLKRFNWKQVPVLSKKNQSSRMDAEVAKSSSENRKKDSVKEEEASVSFEYRKVKNNRPVILPENGILDLTPFCDPTLRQEACQYELVSCITHNGSVDGGHYKVKIKKNNQFYLCNDETVTSIKAEDFYKEDNGYLLVFRRLPTTQQSLSAA
jgi:ubiquitin C-terminal hydrolase